MHFSLPKIIVYIYVYDIFSYCLFQVHYFSLSDIRSFCFWKFYWFHVLHYSNYLCMSGFVSAIIANYVRSLELIILSMYHQTMVYALSAPNNLYSLWVKPSYFLQNLPKPHYDPRLSKLQTYVRFEHDIVLWFPYHLAFKIKSLHIKLSHGLFTLSNFYNNQVMISITVGSSKISDITYI